MGDLILCQECTLPLVLLEMETDKVIQGPETHPFVPAWCETGLHDVEGLLKAMREAEDEKHES